jgi:hypothetical protein
LVEKGAATRSTTISAGNSSSRKLDKTCSGTTVRRKSCVNTTNFQSQLDMYFKNFTRRIEPPAELSGGKKLEMIRALAKIILSSRKYHNNRPEIEYPSDLTARALK